MVFIFKVFNFIEVKLYYKLYNIYKIYLVCIIKYYIINRLDVILWFLFLGIYRNIYYIIGFKRGLNL